MTRGSLFRSMSNSYMKLKEREGLSGKIYITKNNKKISPWHNISPWTNKPNEIIMVNEIPKYNIFLIVRLRPEKFKVSLEEPFNPIVYEYSKNGEEKKQQFTKLMTLSNNGIMPQTWENLDAFIKRTNYYKDGTPLDICEIGRRSLLAGDVIKVLVLGSFCVLDKGKVVWKIMTINSEFAEDNQITNLNKFQEIYPERISQIMDWFTLYEKNKGIKNNLILYGGKLFELDDTLKIINDSHKEYKKMIEKHIWKKKNYWYERPNDEND